MAEFKSDDQPALAETIAEVQGVFPSDAALQDALSKLTLAGFDRADFSLPDADPLPGQATPNQGAADPNTDVDTSQVRNMTTGMTGLVGAYAAAAATIATGGAAAVAIGAAAAVGVGAGAVAHAVNRGAESAQHDEREAHARAGTLILSVRAPTEACQQEAATLMRDAGATKVAGIIRADDEITATGWTG